MWHLRNAATQKRSVGSTTLIIEARDCAKRSTCLSSFYRRFFRLFLLLTGSVALRRTPRDLQMVARQPWTTQISFDAIRPTTVTGGSWQVSRLGEWQGIVAPIRRRYN